MAGVVVSRNYALLISPEFEGIKTRQSDRTIQAIPLLISPEFEGIKTQQVQVISCLVFATDQPRIRGD